MVVSSTTCGHYLAMTSLHVYIQSLMENSLLCMFIPHPISSFPLSFVYLYLISYFLLYFFPPHLFAHPIIIPLPFPSSLSFKSEQFPHSYLHILYPSLTFISFPTTSSIFFPYLLFVSHIISLSISFLPLFMLNSLCHL